MFSGSIIWKGAAYSLLMVLAKMLVSTVVYFEHFMIIWKEQRTTRQKRKVQRTTELQNGPSISHIQSDHDVPRYDDEEQTLPGPPHSIAILVGFAMVARGEIGFLISSLSQSSGTLDLRHPAGATAEILGDGLFLVITWAVALCTIAGPVGVGIVVKRLRQGNAHDLWL